MTLPDQILAIAKSTRFFDLVAQLKAHPADVSDALDRLVDEKRILIELKGHEAFYSAAPVQAELWDKNTDGGV